MENTPASILILDTAWVGDVVFTTSLIGAVKRAWPGSELHILVAPRGEPVVQRHPLVDRVWVYDKHRTQKSLRSSRKLAHTLRGEHFDLILNAHPSFRSRLLTRIIGAPLSIGYRGFGSRSCFTHSIPNDLAVEPDHVVRRVNLLRVLRPDAQPEPLTIGLDPEAVRWAEEFLTSHGAQGSPRLALVCGSAWNTKRWSSDHFAEIARRWHRNGGHTLAIGGRAESDDVAFITAKGEAIPLIQEPLTRVAALLARCEVTVGNDTGVSFLAIAAGCPKVIVLYGSTQVNYNFPAPHKAITAGAPCCLPRTGHGARRCKWGNDPWCMGQISVEKVWQELATR